MNFELYLKVPETIPPEPNPDSGYDPELDDVRSILRDLCASLAELPGVTFSVALSGSLPVSVRRDLVVVMEQLGEALVSLREEGFARLDLYEQGLEARFLFTAEGEETKIELGDLLGRTTTRREARVTREAAVSCLSLLARTFVDAVRRRSPQRTAHPWFTDWERSLVAAAER